MVKRAEPDYVSGRKGRYEIAVPITHPAHCVCAICPEHRRAAAQRLIARAAKFGEALSRASAEAETWAAPLVIRARRRLASIPGIRDSRVAATSYAQNFKRDEEARLAAAVAAAAEQRIARANAVPFGRVCDAYRAYQQKEGKRYDQDRYRIDAVEAAIGRDRDAATIGREDYEVLKELLAGAGNANATIIRYTVVFVAIMNNAVRDGLLASHTLTHLKRPKIRRKRKPVTFTRRQVDVLLGAAMARYEREQAEEERSWVREQEQRRADGRPLLTTRRPSAVPLRGFCLVAYLTLMRPDNNFGLRWEQIRLDPKLDIGRFRLDEHKNSSKGVEVEAGIHPILVRYLRQIHPGVGAVGYVHANHETRMPYVNIRAQWRRLIDIANEMLPDDQQLVAERVHFYTWRHTGASELAAQGGADPVMIVRMMGDTSLKTVMDHYFDSSVEHMQEVLQRWTPSIADALVATEEAEPWITN